MRISDWSSDVCSSDLYAGVQPSAPAVPSISPILMRFFILYLSLPLYFSQAGWLLWQPVALARFQTALMQEVITPDFQLTCRLDLARLTTEATVSQETGGLNPKRPLTASDRSPLDRKSTSLNSSH